MDLGWGKVLALMAWGFVVLAFAAGGLADVTNLWWLVLAFGAAVPFLLVAVHSGSTLIAIAMHGLHNDSVFLQGRISAEGLGPYVISELTLIAPIVAVACVFLLATGRRLGLAEGPREKRVPA